MNLSRIVVVCAFFTLAQSVQRALAQTLIWTPAAPGASWDSASLNWLDNGTPSAWVPGASAVFPAAASGSLIEIAEDLTALSRLF